MSDSKTRTTEQTGTAPEDEVGAKGGERRDVQEDHEAAAQMARDIEDWEYGLGGSCGD